MRWLFIIIALMFFVPIMACGDIETDGKNQELNQESTQQSTEDIEKGIEFVSDNVEYIVYQEAFEDVLARFRAADPFEPIEEPALGFSPLEESNFGRKTAARYEPELNIIVLNSDELEAILTQPNNTLFHELGHAWFEQTPENIQNAYYHLVLSQREGSPNLLTTVVLKLETIDWANPNEFEQILLWRAVKEDFADSFKYYFTYPALSAQKYKRRHAFLCLFFSDSDSHCH